MFTLIVRYSYLSNLIGKFWITCGKLQNLSHNWFLLSLTRGLDCSNFYFFLNIIIFSKRVIKIQTHLMIIKPQLFFPFFNVNAFVCSMHIGHPNLLAVIELNMLYAIKLLIVHIKFGHMTKFCLLKISYVKTPSCHNNTSLSIKICRNTSILLCDY